MLWSLLKAPEPIPDPGLNVIPAAVRAAAYSLYSTCSGLTVVVGAVMATEVEAVVVGVSGDLVVSSLPHAVRVKVMAAQNVSKVLFMSELWPTVAKGLPPLFLIDRIAEGYVTFHAFSILATSFAKCAGRSDSRSATRLDASDVARSSDSRDMCG